MATDRFRILTGQWPAPRALAGWPLALGLAGLLGPTSAQAEGPSTGAKPAAVANGPTAPATAASKAPASTRPLWSELTPGQQKSLEPLAGPWNTLHPAQKRKWIALSGNFDSMSPVEQETLHSRMTEWAALSASDRTRARLNFAEVKRLAPEDERKAKWEAYQALSEEEKRKLAERAGTRPPSAAAPVRPVPAQKFAPVPSVSATASSQFPPRIQLAPPVIPTAAQAPAAPAIAPAATLAPALVSTPPAAAPIPSAPVEPPRPQEAP
ncbi:DUF3106 domain-containing protein [Variovorax sp. OV329]|uniref:DUF3106 domain-containing protein n=1 Tax=Variovorax sp. OV329 TaxID=1882825 RepID=UPI0008E073BC|nr:DUF3106 domain-containing protein [Variovorax sp. OV329]SFM43836.1 Protein of unknown function [Variovorax sp. OV329]